MRNSLVLRLALCGLAFSVGCSRGPQLSSQAVDQTAARVAPAPPPVPLWHGPVVELRGTGEQLGEQHGQQLDKPIQFLHDNYLKVYLGSGTTRLLALGAA